MACAVLLLVACQHEENDVQISEQPLPESFWGTIDLTRTTLGDDADGNKKPFWEAGDAVSLFPEVNTNYRYTTQDEGEVTAQFVLDEATEGVAGAVSEEHAGVYYALYPYQADNAMSGGVATVTLPNAQTITANDFDPKAGLMSATGSDLTALGFSNNAALLRLRLNLSEEWAEKGETLTPFFFEIKVEEGNAIAGKGTIDFSAEEPTFELDRTNGEKNIIATVSNAEAFSEEYVEYYLAVAPGTYSSFELYAMTTKGGWPLGFVDLCEKTGGSITFKRNKIITIRYSIPYIEGWTGIIPK